jgi:hypothetical protein
MLFPHYLEKRIQMKSFSCEHVFFSFGFYSFSYEHVFFSYEVKEFFWGEWAMLAGLKINLRNYYLSTLTAGSSFRLQGKCMVKIL